MPLFQPGMARMYAWTGALPSAFAICGLPPARSLTGFEAGFFAPGDFFAVFAFAGAFFFGFVAVVEDFCVRVLAEFFFAGAMIDRTSRPTGRRTRLRHSLLLRAGVEGDGGADQVLERALVDLVLLADVDGAAGVAFEARVEQR